MSAIRIFAAVALLGSVAFAACPVVSSNPYRTSACAGYVACQTQLCTCAGVNGTSDACLANVANASDCTRLTTCTRGFMMCLFALTAARSNSSDPCNTWAIGLHARLLQGAVGSFNGSAIQTACAARACEIRNRTGTSCSFGTNYSMVCTAPVLATTTTVTSGANGTTTTGVPVIFTTPAGTTFAVTATMTLSGDFTAILADPVQRAALVTALKTDLARLLGIPAASVHILSLTSGSLIIRFAVAEGTNVSTSQLVSLINSATSGTPTWLTSTTGVYGSPISVLSSTGAVATTTTPPPTTAGSGSSSAASVSAALVAAVAALAMLL